jgi:hypothetical protein
LIPLEEEKEEEEEEHRATSPVVLDYTTPAATPDFGAFYYGRMAVRCLDPLRRCGGHNTSPNNITAPVRAVVLTFLQKLFAPRHGLLFEPANTTGDIARFFLSSKGIKKSNGLTASWSWLPGVGLVLLSSGLIASPLLF